MKNEVGEVWGLSSGTNSLIWRDLLAAKTFHSVNRDSCSQDTIRCLRGCVYRLAALQERGSVTVKALSESGTRSKYNILLCTEGEYHCK